jgi:type II secretory pathway pseudopilin PulG
VLVVVSIIALLVGILLPAIGKAREQANLTKSQANIKQIGTALATYSAEYQDRQLTYVNDNFSHYGPDGVIGGDQLRQFRPGTTIHRSIWDMDKAVFGDTSSGRVLAQPETG